MGQRFDANAVAKDLIRSHGPRAEARARLCLEALQWAGDLDGQDEWWKVLTAIERLGPAKPL